MHAFLKKCAIVFLFAFLTNPLLFGQKSEPSTILTFRIDETIEVDGDLDEDIWDEGPEISTFIQRELDEGQPATEETNVIILYDNEYLYIGIEALDSEPDKIVAKESRRDFFWQTEDNIKIVLSPYNNKRDGYMFIVNPNGAKADALISRDGVDINLDWDGVWEAGALIDDEDGWEVEIAIPFSTLNFPESEQQIWGLNIERNIKRKNETVLWQGWSRNYRVEQVSQAGNLYLRDNISRTNTWEFKPFALAGIAREKRESNVGKFKVGGDVNYLISTNMKLNLTVNTDFSQVESDREEINLTRFSLFFPEKRDFFLEGKNLFEFKLGEDAQSFYSRRIGLNSKGEDRKEIPIIAGARLVGKSETTHIGLMSVQTSKNDSIPSTNYSILRIKQDLFKQSHVGFIFTTKNDAESNNHLYGVDANYATSEFLTDKNLEAGFTFSHSITKNKENKNAIGYNFYINYPNDFSEFRLNTSRITKSFNPQMGFLRRNNYKLISSELQFNPRPDSLLFIKNFEFKPFEFNYYLNDTNNNLESFEYELVPLAIEFKSGDVIELNGQRFFEKLENDFEIVDDEFISSGEYWFTRYELALESYDGRKVFTESQISWGEFYSGTGTEIETLVGVNLSNQLNISADWERNIINLENKEFTTDEIGARIEYAFSPVLYTSLFSQWNNEDDEALLDFRFNWIPKTGSQFYFVINQEFSTSGKIAALNTTVLTKLNWFFSQ